MKTKGLFARSYIYPALQSSTFDYLCSNIVNSISFETGSQLCPSASHAESRKGNKTVWKEKAKYDGKTNKQKNHSAVITRSHFIHSSVFEHFYHFCSRIWFAVSVPLFGLNFYMWNAKSNTFFTSFLLVGFYFNKEYLLKWTLYLAISSWSCVMHFCFFYLGKTGSFLICNFSRKTCAWSYLLSSCSSGIVSEE